jgi:fido (protein-threonine AMPylation protein)
MDEKELYINFDEYIRQGEPSQRESAYAWSTAIGLQAVDGLKTSGYLNDLARRNIEGELTIDEVENLLNSYYESKTTREADDDDKEEADKASKNIKKILSVKTCDFSTKGYISIHRRIFEGVMKHAGELRKYDITKREWVLESDTVNYQNWEDLRRSIDYDIAQERDFSYKGLSNDEIVVHITKFVSGLWQIHAFGEGNTRTTAVFVIQYLRSIGFDVENDLFAKHSWYFRNALVRANYKSPDKLPDKLPDKFNTNNQYVKNLVKVVGSNELSVKEMLSGLGLKDRESFMDVYLNPAIKGKFVRMLYPNSPRHPRQKYLLTVKGLALYNEITNNQ